MKLTGELNAATDLGFRAVSGASESIIEASQVHLDGTPGLIPTSTTHCTDNSHTSPSVTSVLSSAGTYSIGWSYGGRQDHSTGVLFTSHLITTAMDLGQGWSGGGYWYESAAGGDFLVGVHSGFTTIIDWGATSDGENTGPKHDIFRAWVNSTI